MLSEINQSEKHLLNIMASGKLSVNVEGIKFIPFQKLQKLMTGRGEKEREVGKDWRRERSVCVTSGNLQNV